MRLKQNEKGIFVNNGSENDKFSELFSYISKYVNRKCDMTENITPYCIYILKITTY